MHACYLIAINLVSWFSFFFFFLLCAFSLEHSAIKMHFHISIYKESEICQPLLEAEVAELHTPVQRLNENVHCTLKLQSKLALPISLTGLKFMFLL